MKLSAYLSSAAVPLVCLTAVAQFDLSANAQIVDYASMQNPDQWLDVGETIRNAAPAVGLEGCWTEAVAYQFLNNSHATEIAQSDPHTAEAHEAWSARNRRNISYCQANGHDPFSMDQPTPSPRSAVARQQQQPSSGGGMTDAQAMQMLNFMFQRNLQESASRQRGCEAAGGYWNSTSGCQRVHVRSGVGAPPANLPGLSPGYGGQRLH